VTPKDPFRTLDDPEPGKGPITEAWIQSLSAREISGDRIVTPGWRQPPGRPNPWRRFWAWALLGVTWEKME